MIVMTVDGLLSNSEFSPVVLPDGEREISGVYIGDLLSWVMGRANSGDAWITIMSNINILAVATLADTACIVLAEGVQLDDDIIKTAADKNVNIISSDKGIYETALLLSKIL